MNKQEEIAEVKNYLSIFLGEMDAVEKEYKNLTSRLKNQGSSKEA